MSAEVISFGCRLNLAEGEALQARLADVEDLIVINSCAVTAEAERQARQAIRRAARTRPDARIVVTGCAAEVSAERFSAMPEVALVEPSKASLSRPPRIVAREPAISGANHARAFVEVQNGCDHACTFCITTIARGNSRSIPANSVIRGVEECVARGQQEIVLTGVDLTSYGQDMPDTPVLGTLVSAILERVPTLPRLRLSSLDSVEIDPLLEDLITSEPRIMPHIHLSLQHGDDVILKRMKRRHSRADAVDLVARLKRKRPEIAIGADIIAGFPTESAEAFANSLSLLDACDVVLAHVFPYSPRPGTAAARMPQLDRQTIKDRAAQLREKAAIRKAAWLDSMIGTTQTTLIELDGQTGHIENFAPVRLEARLPSGNMQGMITKVRIIASDGTSLTGVPL